MLNGNVPQLIKDENSAFQMVAMSVLGDRDDQQDSFGYGLMQEEGLVVVCDGMGGHEGGKMASELAADLFLERYGQMDPQENPLSMLLTAAKRADEGISQLKDRNGECLRAGSTLVSVLVSRRKLLWCSVGDSRAYLMRGGEMVQLTLDHNYHTVLIGKRNAGLLDEAAFREESARGEALISFLGIGNLALVDYSETPLEIMRDDKIILMSDGLYKLVSDSEIARILDNFQNIADAVQALEMKARKNAKLNAVARDNMTVAILKIK